MEKFVIEGGVPLSGTLVPAGNKNGALPILASALLTEDEVTVCNVPRIRDVEAMLEILGAIGVQVAWRGTNEVTLCAAGVHTVEIDRELAELIRASFLLAGPLLARVGRASVPPPGGDVIGRRRLDPHLHAFERLGAQISVGERYELQADRLEGAAIFLDEASVMGTENTVMAAVLAPGATTITNAA
ncbi:MAG TPA: UDP-N-acetylglucosamine 1-carboxyvinyltransferase, partial [Solirubrobacteraceae bacterium]